MAHEGNEPSGRIDYNRGERRPAARRSQRKQRTRIDDFAIAHLTEKKNGSR